MKSALPVLIRRTCLMTCCCLLLTACDKQQTDTSALEGEANQLGVVIYSASTIITMDEENPRAEAVSVADGRVLSVGSLAEVSAAHPGATVDERFADKVLIAGFIDQHIHPFLAALTLTSHVVSIEEWVLPEVVYPAARDAGEYLSLLQAAERSMPADDTPLISWGYHHYFHGDLSREILDSISSTRPIIIWHRSAHEFYVNSPALAAIGVTQATVAGQPREIKAQMDFQSGHFWERGAFEFLLPYIMPMLAAPERFHAGLTLLEQYLHSSGVTVSAEPGGSADYYEAYNRVLGDPATPFRFYFIPSVRSADLARWGDALVAETEAVAAPVTSNTGPLRGHVKLFSDGAMFSQLMQMQDGYDDGHHGEWLTPPDDFARLFEIFWDAGYQIHIHQNGDEGLEMVLDSLSENQQRKPRDDHRTTIVHFGFAKAEQVTRLAELGAIVSANPYYTIALSDRYGEIGIGTERADQMVRLGDVARAGMSFSFHSDMPMAPARPLFLVWTAVNRVTPSSRVAGPEQRVSVEDALAAVTIEAAYSLRLENEIGSITPGKRANFTILEEDPFVVDPMSIKDLVVLGTVFEGSVKLTQ